MSREQNKEVEKVVELLKRSPLYCLAYVGQKKMEITKEYRDEQLWGTARFLVDEGVRSASGFEIEQEGIGERKRLDNKTTHGLGLAIKPIQYSEAKDKQPNPEGVIKCDRSAWRGEG